MKYLILGSSGFIGTNLVDSILSEEGNQAILYASTHTRIRKGFESRAVSVLRDFATEQEFESLLDGVDIVYHLISTTCPANTNMDIPAELTNLVKPTTLLLQEAVKRSVRVIFISSGGTVYGNGQIPPFNENMREDPINAYGVHKVMLEKLFGLYGYLEGLDYKIVRLSNPYGPGQDPTGSLGVVTKFVNKAISGDVASIYGDGTVVRDYIYIDDVIAAFRKIERYDGEYHIFNLGSGEPISIRDVVAQIEKSLSIKMNVERMPGRIADSPVNYLDVSRFTSCFGYPATTSLCEGIKKTAEFLKKQNAMPFTGDRI